MVTTSHLVIDVREADEFKAERIPGSIHLPLSQLDVQAPGILAPLRNCELTVMCRSGNRARLAMEKFLGAGLVNPEKTQIFAGGILEWKRQGRPTEGSRAGVLPLMRQVQLGAGLLTLTGGLLAIFVDPAWVGLPLFVGAGLTVAGSTGFCGMALLLQRMPWNRVTPQAKPSCATS